LGIKGTEAAKIREMAQALGSEAAEAPRDSINN
jgi:hypothetical protein